VIRFSAGLVVVAIGVLIGGVATSKLSLVYVAIAVSASALVALAIGVVLKREELFGGGPELVPAGAGASPGLPASGRTASSSPAPPTANTTVGGSGAVADGATSSVGGGARQPWATQPQPVISPSAGQDRPANGQDAFSAVAYSSGAHVRPTWTPREPEPRRDPDRSAALAGGWTTSTTPPSGTPPVAPRAWEGAKASVVSPSGSSGTSAPAAPAGSGGTLRSWFDRPAQPEPPAVPPADEVPASATDTAGGTDVQADEDDDWPTRYSWLDDDETESEESLPSGESASADEPVPEALMTSDSKPNADVEDPDAEDGAPASPAATDPDLGESAETEPLADEPLADEFDDVDGADETDSSDAAPEPVTASEIGDDAEDEPPGGTKQGSGAKLVTVVPGVPRYHEPNCILIRFMPEDDVQTKSIPEAKAINCTPCAACQPED